MLLFLCLSMFIVSFVRANFLSPWNENARTEQKQQTNWNRAIFLVYRTDTNPRFFWLVERTLGGKKFMPENCPEINRILRYDVILQHDWPIEQCLLQIGVQQRQRIKNDVQNIFDICKVLYMKKISLILKTAEWMIHKVFSLCKYLRLFSLPDLFIDDVENRCPLIR